MRIVVFGATGMAGREVVTEALRRGHSVVAASRRGGAPGDQDLTRLALDVADGAAASAALTGADAAVLAIRPAPGEEARLAPLTHGVLDAAARHGARVLIVGGAAPLRSPNHPDRLLIDDPAFVPEAWRRIAAASLEQLRVCEAHPAADWVYLSPAAQFEPGDPTGRYRRGETTLLTDAAGRSRIAAADLALAVLDELEHPSGERHFTVAEAPAPPSPVGAARMTFGDGGV